MKRLIVAFGLVWLLGLHAAGAVGFQWATVQDGDQPPLRVAIWYPSHDPTTDANLVAFDMQAAINGKIDAGRFPLIVMSHGTGGSALNSFDTAVALAEAGFVVASVTHTGDNYQDRSTSFTRQEFVDRPRHISRLIDFMLATWSDHASIEPDRIGVFGHSAGGTTSLILIGGVADLGRIAAFCRENPDDWGCREARQRGRTLAEADLTPTAVNNDVLPSSLPSWHGLSRPPTQAPAATGGPDEPGHDGGGQESVSTPTGVTPVSSHDPRLKAAVLAAPALTVAFQPRGLAAVTVPVQLWVDEHDDYAGDASPIRTLLPTAPDYHFVQNGGHFAFLTPCNEILTRSAPEICADPEGFDRTSFLQSFHQSVIAFYRKHFAVAKLPPG